MSSIVAVSIPMVMLAAPGIGGYLGYLADRRWGCPPWGVSVGVVFGLVAAVIRTRAILRQISGGSAGKGA